MKRKFWIKEVLRFLSQNWVFYAINTLKPIRTGRTQYKDSSRNHKQRKKFQNIEQIHCVQEKTPPCLKTISLVPLIGFWWSLSLNGGSWGWEIDWWWSHETYACPTCVRHMFFSFFHVARQCGKVWKCSVACSMEEWHDSVTWKCGKAVW